MKERTFKIVTGIVAAYHLALGVVGLTLPVETIAEVVKAVLGFVLEPTDQLPVILKFASVYLLAFGGMMLLLFSNPVKYRVFALPALALFGVRFVINIVFFDVISPDRTGEVMSYVSLGLIAFFFLAILFTMPKASDES
jgi:hypothetical protein